jgi:hypothetical protein
MTIEQAFQEISIGEEKPEVVHYHCSTCDMVYTWVRGHNNEFCKHWLQFFESCE